jgi:hypothetical protein
VGTASWLIASIAFAQAPAPIEPPPSTAEPAPAAPPAPPPEAAREPTPAPEPPPHHQEGHGKPEGKRHGKHGKHDDSDKRDDGDKRDRQGDDDADGARGFVLTSAAGSLKLKGRVMALAELSHHEDEVVSAGGGTEMQTRNALDLSLESARIGFEYRSPERWLSAEVELEVSGKPKVKDAFVQAGKRYFVKAGQFKLPSPALELESPWDIPLARRGLMHDLLVDWLDVAGRRPGFAVGYRGKSALKPRLTLGAFQGTTLDSVAPGERDVTLIDHASLEAQTYAARGELSPARWLALGAWFEQRVGSTLPGDFEHYATGGLDATFDRAFQGGALRAWLDGSAGESLYVNDDKPDQESDPVFVLGRALVAYRFGGAALGDPYLEPFGFFALLDPDIEVVDDFATEAALGVNLGLWDRARLTLQGELTSAQRNFPSAFLDHQNPDQLSLLLMAGARF